MQAIGVMSALFLSGALSCQASAAEVIEPEKCIVDALKNNAQPSIMLHYNCVRQYINAVEPSAQEIPIALFASAKLTLSAPIAAIPSAIPEKVTINLQNPSGFVVISADIGIWPKDKSNDIQIYRLYADTPINSMAAGTLSGQTMSGASSGEFANNWSWAFKAVYGVKR